MNRNRLKRVSTAAGIGLFCLGGVAAVHAEGGEGSSLVPAQPPQGVAEVESRAEASAPQAVPEDPEGVSDPRAARKTGGIPRSGGSEHTSGLSALIRRYSAQNDVPFGLADAIIRIESRYNAGARNGPHMGLTQIHTATARSLGYGGEATGLLDAETNLRYGMKYIATAYRLAGGDTCGTILRYQAGARARTMTEAARRYCARVKLITAGAE